MTSTYIDTASIDAGPSSPIPGESPTLQTIRQASQGVFFGEENGIKDDRLKSPVLTPMKRHLTTTFNQLSPVAYNNNYNNIGDPLIVRCEQPVENVTIKPYTLLRGGGEVNSTEYEMTFKWYKSTLNYRCAFKDCPHSHLVSSAPLRRSTLQCVECVMHGKLKGESSYCCLECFKAGTKSKAHALEHHRSPEHLEILKRMFTNVDTEINKVLCDTSYLTPYPSEDDWILIHDEKTFTPTKEDIGRKLKLQVTAIHLKDGVEYSKKTVLTNLVLPVPPPVMARREHRSTLYHEYVNKGKRIRVVSYNVLAEIYCTKKVYPYCPTWAMLWAYRKNNLLKELLAFNADILCLQEVQKDHYENFIYPELAKYGYQGVYTHKNRETMGGPGKIDGCATFYKVDQFTVLQEYTIDYNDMASNWADHMYKSNATSGGSRSSHATNARNIKKGLNRLTHGNIAQILVLNATKTTTTDGTTGSNTNIPKNGRYMGNGNSSSGGSSDGVKLCVANTHIFWDPEYPDVKLWQTNCLIRELEKFNLTRKLPLILCGDFNSEPTSSVYELLSCQSVRRDHLVWDKDKFNVLPASSSLTHSISLSSAYQMVFKTEPELTNCTNHYKGVLDYIWFSVDSLVPISMLEVHNDEDLIETCKMRLPNAIYPSDHLSLCADFILPTSSTTTTTTTSTSNGNTRYR